MLLFGEFSIQFLFAVGFVLLIGMGWHEYAHAVVADWWGDPTPRSHGRLTPNPFVHIYWPGWLMFVFIGFGILGSVPVNPTKMRDPRWGNFWTSFAGPLSNLVMGVISAILLRLVSSVEAGIIAFNNPGSVNDLGGMIALVLFTSVFFNMLLFVFNLLPFFPIDGYHMLLALLPGYWLTNSQVPAFIQTNMPPLSRFLQQPAFVWHRWAQVTQYVLLGLIFLSFVPGFPNPLGIIIGNGTFTLSRLVLGI